MKEGAVTTSNAASRLRQRKEHVLSRWEEELRREIPAAGREPQSVLINTLPAVLDQLAEALSPLHPRRTATQGSTVATEHGGERVRITRFRLEDVIREYKVLRQVLFEVLEEDVPLSRRERDTLNASLDQALMEACTGYVLVLATYNEQLLAILAHDMRTPLGVAHTNAALIQRDPGAPEVPIWAGRILDNVDRLDRMLQDLLDASRLESGARIELDLEESDLVDIVREALDHWSTQLGDRLVFDGPEPVLGYYARDGLRRAVDNLVSNAVKYGSATTPIEVAVRSVHGRALVTVHNDGALIPAEEQETLFRAFQRASEAEASGKRGWGLGLAQVRAVAEAHGGSIGVDSVRGAGTTFLIDVPADARPFQQIR